MWHSAHVETQEVSQGSRRLYLLWPLASGKLCCYIVTRLRQGETGGALAQFLSHGDYEGNVSGSHTGLV